MEYKVLLKNVSNTTHLFIEEINLRLNKDNRLNNKTINWYFQEIKSHSLLRLNNKESPNK